MQEEIWKKIEGYPNYSVSNKGRVRNDNSDRIRVPKNKNGYRRINLCRNGFVRNHYIHRLVAEAYVPNPENKPQVNHINENKSDNRDVNLEWVTSSENTNYGTGNQRRSYSQINDSNKSKPIVQYTLDGVFVKEYPSSREAHRSTGINRGHISSACNGNKKSAGGYLWKKKENI